MAIISVRDNENNRWKRNTKAKGKKKLKQKERQKKTRGDRSYSERMRA